MIEYSLESSLRENSGQGRKNARLVIAWKQQTTSYSIVPSQYTCGHFLESPWDGRPNRLIAQIF
jgi:hypothetical protein